MSPLDHYRKAEDLLRSAWRNSDEALRMQEIASAQVHAMLSLAARIDHLHLLIAAASTPTGGDKT